MSLKVKKPNIIFITLDGARYDRIKNMPNFKKISEKSSLFSQMITYAPYTISSMFAIFSGTYGYRNGVDNYYSSPFFKKNKFSTITSYLKKEGYITIADLLNEICVPKEGFDRISVHDPSKYNLFKVHSDLLNEMSKLDKKGKNFFLFLHHSKIQHNIKINVSKKYNNFSKEYFVQKKKNLEAYDSYVMEADNYLGQILKKIKELGLEDSIIIINSDHGMGVGEKFGEKAYGVYCYDYTLKVFTILHNPSIFPEIEIKQQVRTIDLFPTILDYIGIIQDKNFEKIDGKSMKNLIDGGKDIRDAYAESGNPYPDPKIPPKKPNVKAIRINGWKFIRNLWDNNSEELYNLEKDPEEKNNLIKIEIKKAKELRALLNAHIQRALKEEIRMKLKSLS